MELDNTVVADWDSPPGIVAFSTTRIGGISAVPYASFNLAKHVGDDASRVQRNRTVLAENLPPKVHWQWLQQVHGCEVVTVSKPASELCADAIVTASPNLVCCVQTADCLPVFLAAKSGEEVALAHAGWRGLASGIVENTVASMSVPAAEVIAWLGPAIGPCHFEVGEEVKALFLDAVSSTESKTGLEPFFRSTMNTGKFMADIYAIARFKLLQLGVVQVFGGSRCTYCEEDLFFSYRRDGVTGRMLNLIYIEG